jgi:hypothetical protein
MALKLALVTGLLAIVPTATCAAYLCTDGRGNDYYEDYPCPVGHASPRQGPDEVAREIKRRNAEAEAARRRGAVSACGTVQMPPAAQKPTPVAQSGSASCRVGGATLLRHAGDS